MRAHFLLSLSALALLAACAGGGPGPTAPTIPDGKFERYDTDHAPLSRVRRTLAAPAGYQKADNDALAQFDSKGSGPDGYLDLMKQYGDTQDPNKFVIEAIATVDGSGKANRLVRLTVDNIRLVPGAKDIAIAQTDDNLGQYFFRGKSFAWVTIADGPLLSGSHSGDGLVDLMVDFKNGTASIDLRTEKSGTSDIEIHLKGQNLTFNVETGVISNFDPQTGTVASNVDISVKHPSLGVDGTINGRVEGTVGGTPAWSNGEHGLTTSGQFTGSGDAKFEDTTAPVVIDGIWFGTGPANSGPGAGDGS